MCLTATLHSDDEQVFGFVFFFPISNSNGFLTFSGEFLS